MEIHLVDQYHLISDGSILAVGAPYGNLFGSTFKGHVQVYKLNNTFLG